METFSASLAICAGNSPVPCEFRAQKPVTQSFDVNNGEAGDLRRYRAHYDVIVMKSCKILFAHYLFRSCHIVLKYIAQYSLLLCAKFQTIRELIWMLWTNDISRHSGHNNLSNEPKQHFTSKCFKGDLL